MDFFAAREGPTCKRHFSFTDHIWSDQIGPHEEAKQRGDFCFVMIQSSSAYRHGGQVAQVDSTLA